MGIEGLDKLTEEDEKPYRDAGYPAGPVSMGHGRKMEPNVVDGKVTNGTAFIGCPNSPDTFHHFTAVSCIQSIEHFVCDYCPEYFYD
jgi:hypothetical protein